MPIAGDFAGDREVYEEALVKRELRTAYSTLGVVYCCLGEFDEALPMRRKAVDLSPGEVAKWSNLADALYSAANR